MIYLNQNRFTIVSQSVRENCNLFFLFEQRGEVLTSIYQDFFNYIELNYTDFTIYVIRYGKSLIITLSLINLTLKI